MLAVKGKARGEAVAIVAAARKSQPHGVRPPVRLARYRPKVVVRLTRLRVGFLGFFPPILQELLPGSVI